MVHCLRRTMLASRCYLLLTLMMAPSLSAVPSGRSEGEQSTLSCSEAFSLHGASCYRYYGGRGCEFHQAEKCCVRQHSSLVSLLDAEEEAFVVQLAENNASFWIGLNDEEGPTAFHKEGVFKWSDGHQFDVVWSYQNWRVGEPNNRKHMDCVKVSAEGWAMASGGCGGSKLPFVCKKQACPSEGSTAPGGLTAVWTCLFIMAVLVAVLAYVLCRTNTAKTHCVR